MKKETSNDKNVQLPGRGEYNSLTSLPIIIIMGIISMLLWIVMFSLGLLINSKPYRDTILSHFNLPDFFMSIITFTPTNIAFLCIIAAFSGGCASRLVIIGIHKNPPSDSQFTEKDKTDSQFYMMENPFSSMLRGLVVFFAFLAGVFVAAPNPFAETSPQQYAQAAGVVSLFSFIVGYDPTVFRSFISLAGKMKQKENVQKQNLSD